MAELKRAAGMEGVPQGIVEKDYVLSVALNAISWSKDSNGLVFKGGTAIRKAYFKEARFSEDLDFTAPGQSSESLLGLLEETVGGKVLDGVEFSQIEGERTSAGLKASVRFTGPSNHPQRIRFDFSFRENLAEKPARMRLLSF